MKPDLSLLSPFNGFCKAIEKTGRLCFGKLHGRGFCHKHYQRLLKYNDINLPDKEPLKCIFIDCNCKHYAKGYCINHYMNHISRRKKYEAKERCSIENCEDTLKSKGLCGKHYMRHYRHGDVAYSHKQNPPPIRLGKYKHVKCIAPGCQVVNEGYKTHLVKGLCTKHYQRWLKHGNYNINMREKNNK